jgi:hypothetical protein
MIRTTTSGEISAGKSYRQEEPVNSYENNQVETAGDF